MATTSHTKTRIDEQLVDLGRKAGTSFVDAYETTANTVADYQDKVADSTQVEWIAATARAQADLTREITRVYSASARELLN